MTFQPVVPLGGYSGWRFLSQSLDAQMERYAQTPVLSRDMDYFRENISNVRTPENLVSDYRLLRVALSAYGLQDDLPNRAFIEKVVSDGVSADDALSNRLADKRYRAFSEAFGFGTPLPPRTQQPGFADRILAKFERQSFELAIGEQDEDMRLALTAERELRDLGEKGYSETTAWLNILGNPPLRQVMETALGLPASIGSLDLDKQVSTFRDAAENVLGISSIDELSDGEAIETVIQSFTIRSQATAGPNPLTPGFTALTLLQGLG